MLLLFCRSSICRYIAKTLYGDDDEEVTPQNSGTVEEPKCLGLYLGSNEKILLKNGPYGFYVQLGEERKGYLPKRASVSQNLKPNDITFEKALELLLGKDVKRCGRLKSKPKLEGAVEAI
ncbi:uncharacterized protein LOC114300977 [Camellia sinensis]|uniref:uncharacterized protein LOC114300977 n=1 Tax=Camellia sinensis TaxID=4442 RepID=UPI001035C6A1|nr:uncharacterized protein LOC114300977 [Camellia sinensis]